MESNQNNSENGVFKEEFIDAFKLLPIAAYSAYAHIKGRYRRTTLGPFWLTLSAGITILVLGLIWGSVFGADLNSFFPYVTVGYITWGLISSLILEAPLFFFEQATVMRNVKLPIFYYVSSFLIKNLIVYAHNFVIVVFVMIVFQVPILPQTFLFLPNMVLLILIGYFGVVILGMLASRFHDLHPMVNSVTMLIFLMTPILWQPSAIVGKRAILVEFNPFFHFIELIRAPLLGSVPTVTNYAVSITFLIVTGVVSVYLLKKYRHRLVYWV